MAYVAECHCSSHLVSAHKICPHQTVYFWSISTANCMCQGQRQVFNCSGRRLAFSFKLCFLVLTFYFQELSQKTSHLFACNRRCQHRYGGLKDLDRIFINAYLTSLVSNHWCPIPSWVLQKRECFVPGRLAPYKRHHSQGYATRVSEAEEMQSFLSGLKWSFMNKPGWEKDPWWAWILPLARYFHCKVYFAVSCYKSTRKRASNQRYMVTSWASFLPTIYGFRQTQHLRSLSPKA